LLAPQDDQSAGSRQGYYEAFSYTASESVGGFPPFSIQLAGYDR